MREATQGRLPPFHFRPSYLWKMLRRVDSVDELRRLTIAGVNILGFGLAGD